MFRTVPVLFRSRGRLRLSRSAIHSAVHQEKQLQHAAEALFPPPLHPDHGALPAGILPEKDPQLEGGPAAAGCSFPNRDRSGGRCGESPLCPRSLLHIGLIQQPFYLQKELDRAMEWLPILPARMIQPPGKVSIRASIHANQGQPISIFAHDLSLPSSLISSLICSIIPPRRYKYRYIFSIALHCHSFFWHFPPRCCFCAQYAQFQRSMPPAPTRRLRPK